jgi:hypothetical protein
MPNAPHAASERPDIGEYRIACALVIVTSRMENLQHIKQRLNELQANTSAYLVDILNNSDVKEGKYPLNLGPIRVNVGNLY